MQKNFYPAVSFTLQYEGGYVDAIGDPGGATNRGITLATYRADVKPGASIADLKAMTTAAAAAIYHKHYWTWINADALASGVDIIAFDIAVNMGVGRARQFLAQTANLPPRARVLRLHALRMGFWRRLSSWARFGAGWTRRETACMALALHAV